MTAFVDPGSTFVDEAGNTQPLFNSPFIVQDKNNDDPDSDGSISANTAGTGLALNLTIIGDSPSTVVTDKEEPLSDKITTGAGSDLIDVGGGDDEVDGGEGADLVFAGTGDDIVRGGVGADFLRGGEGSDTYLIVGDEEEGAFGEDSDLQFDEQGRVIHDFISDFDDNADQLILQNLGLGTSVTYNPQTGAVTMTDEDGISYPIVQLLPGLDITVNDEGDGNFTLE